MAPTTSSSSSSTTQQASTSALPLYERYPVTSCWELTLHNGNEKIRGEIYCTDPISQIVVLIDQTTLRDVRMVSVNAIKESKKLSDATMKDVSSLSTTNSTNSNNQSANTIPTKKVLEEREKKAIRLAQERFLHINPKASPQGQITFDRLLKACNEVVWKGESIIVLNQIQVDPPYNQENCKLLKGNGSGGGGSLDRVQKIVAAAAAITP